MASDVAPVDAAVIGAGVGGLATAAALVEAGRSVVVLESRDRIGGRLLSADLASGDARADLGATWFWPGEHRVAALVRRLGLAVHDHFLDGDALYQDTAGTRRVDGNPIDVPSFRFTDGAQCLAEAVAALLPPGTVRLETPVHRVVVGDDAVRVASGDSEILARHVVMALPPALALDAIEIDPPLDTDLDRLARSTPVWMGAFTKVAIRFADPFWREHGLSGSAMSHVGPMREIHDMSGPNGRPAMLFGFVPGRPGVETVTERAVLDQVSALFGSDAPPPLEIHIRDWRREPASSPPDVERLGQYQTYGHPRFQAPAQGGRLHWASTETSPVAPGHIEGALAAAERATAAIERSLTEAASSTPTG